MPITLPPEPDSDTRHARHLYTILVDEKRCGVSRNRFLDAMIEARIGIGVHYLSIPEHPYYQTRFRWRPEQFPYAISIGRRTANLPLSPKLENNDVEDVIAAVRSLVAS